MYFQAISDDDFVEVLFETAQITVTESCERTAG